MGLRPSLLVVDRVRVRCYRRRASTLFQKRWPTADLERIDAEPPKWWTWQRDGSRQEIRRPLEDHQEFGARASFTSFNHSLPCHFANPSRRYLPS